MKLNELKVKLVKISGTNIFYGKGKLELDRHIITESKGFWFMKKSTRYIIDTAHIKRDRKGKALVFLDMNTHKSLGDKITKSILPLNQSIDGELLNTLDFLVDKEYHKANMEIPKLSRWEKISYMFVGFGVLFFILEIIKAITGRIIL